MAGWWLTYPSEKYESQLGLLFPIYEKIKPCSKPPIRHGVLPHNFNTLIIVWPIRRVWTIPLGYMSPESGGSTMAIRMGETSSVRACLVTCSDKPGAQGSPGGSREVWSMSLWSLGFQDVSGRYIMIYRQVYWVYKSTLKKLRGDLPVSIWWWKWHGGRNDNNVGLYMVIVCVYISVCKYIYIDIYIHSYIYIYIVRYIYIHSYI